MLPAQLGAAGGGGAGGPDAGRGGADQLHTARTPPQLHLRCGTQDASHPAVPDPTSWHPTRQLQKLQDLYGRQGECHAQHTHALMPAISLRWYVADGEVHPVGDPTPAAPPAPAPAGPMAPAPAPTAQPPPNSGGAPSSAQAWYSEQEEGEAGAGIGASQAAAAPAAGGPSANGASATHPNDVDYAPARGGSYRGPGAAASAGFGAAGASAIPERDSDRRAFSAERSFE